MQLLENIVLIRVKSHRARANMERALGYKPAGYFSFYFDGEFRAVLSSECEKLCGIKGLTRARVDTSKLLGYWT